MSHPLTHSLATPMTADSGPRLKAVLDGLAAELEAARAGHLSDTDKRLDRLEAVALTLSSIVILAMKKDEL